MCEINFWEEWEDYIVINSERIFIGHSGELCDRHWRHHAVCSSRHRFKLHPSEDLHLACFLLNSLQFKFFQKDDHFAPLCDYWPHHTFIRQLRFDRRAVLFCSRQRLWVHPICKIRYRFLFFRVNLIVQLYITLQRIQNSRRA